MERGGVHVSRSGYSDGTLCSHQDKAETNWLVAWCHEMSFKQAGSMVREVLSRHASDMGGGFKCFKRSDQFAEWSSHVTRPYVLFTNWREAKHCILGMKKRAMLTVILCADSRQEKRAQLWVSNLTKHKDPVHPVAMSSLDVALPHLLMQALEVCGDVNLTAHPQVQAIPPTKAGERPPGTFRQTLVKERSGRVHPYFPRAQLKADMTELKGGPGPNHAFQPTWPERTSGKRGHPCSHDHPQPLVFSSQSAPSKNAVPKVLPCGELAMLNFPDVVARVWHLLKCPEKVKCALLAALPDHYED